MHRVMAGYTSSSFVRSHLDEVTGTHLAGRLDRSDLAGLPAFVGRSRSRSRQSWSAQTAGRGATSEKVIPGTIYG